MLIHYGPAEVSTPLRIRTTMADILNTDPMQTLATHNSTIGRFKEGTEMSSILLLATCLVAAPNGVQSLSLVQSRHARSAEGAAASSHRGVGDLDRAVREVIPRFDRAEQSSREELVPELVSLYSDLIYDTHLKPRRRSRLVRLVRRRLREKEQALVRRLQWDDIADRPGQTKAHSLGSRSVKTRSHTAVVSRSKPSAVLAQRAGGAQPGGAARGAACPLVEVGVGSEYSVCHLDCLEARGISLNCQRPSHLAP